MTTMQVRFTGWPGLSPADVYKVTVVGGGGGLTVSEVDGAPLGTPSGLKFPNGTLTDNGDGSFTFAPTAVSQSTGSALALSRMST